MPGPEPDPRWLRLWASFGVSSDCARTDWVDLVARYSEPHRAYHTLAHVLNCQHELDACRALASDPGAVEAALWFHDVVYEPQGNGNEEASAAFALEVLGRAGMDLQRQGRVERLILATRHAAVPEDGDGALVVDIDLAILGAATEEFDRYERAIRIEYAWVPEMVYRMKRIEVLEGFLARPALYATEAFRERLELRARENLGRSIALLRGRA
jgi:predicted metal-dependent HD superfamily phosphohydrolase